MPATIILVLSVSTSHKWPIKPFDVIHTFLQEKLEDDVYMMQLPGFTDKENLKAV